MIIKHGDQYHYVYGASSFTCRVLSWSDRQLATREVNPLSGICLALSLLGLPVFIAGVGCYINVGRTEDLFFVLAGSVLLSPWAMILTRQILRYWAVRRGALGRMGAVSFRKVNGRYESDSYAVGQLSRTPKGKEWLDAVTACAVSSSHDLARYYQCITTNPNDKLFPKLKVYWDGYLMATATHDEGLRAYGSRSIVEAQRLRNEVNDEARRVSSVMDGIKAEHVARSAGIARTLKQGGRQEAEIMLGGISPLYK